MTANEKRALQINACKVRMGVIEGTYAAKSGHPGGSLSSADLFTYLYFRELNVDPAQPDKPERDRFVLSKGHCAPGLYAAMALRGFFPWEDLKTLRHIGSHLQGHPNMRSTPGRGSFAAWRPGPCRVYTLLGDGKIEEGQVWEAFMFARHYKLDNLRVIIDNNGLQIDGPVDQVMSPYPILDKLSAFGFETAEIDGHDFDALEGAFTQANAVQGRPFAIVMKTVKGKGVSYMENQAGWHGKAPNLEQYETALAELRATLTELEVE